MPFPESGKNSFDSNFIDYLSNSNIFMAAVKKFFPAKDSARFKELILKDTSSLSRIFNELPVSYSWKQGLTAEKTAPEMIYRAFDSATHEQLFACYEKLVVSEIDEVNNEIPEYLEKDIEGFLKRAIKQAGYDLFNKNGQLKIDIATLIGINDVLPTLTPADYVSKIIYPIISSYIGQIIITNMALVHHEKYKDNQDIIQKGSIIPGKFAYVLDKIDPISKNKLMSDFFYKETTANILTHGIFTKEHFNNYLTTLTPKEIAKMVSFDISQMKKHVEPAIQAELYKKREKFWIEQMFQLMATKDYNRLFAIYSAIPSSLKQSWNECKDSVDLSNPLMLVEMGIKEDLNILLKQKEQKHEENTAQLPHNPQLMALWFNARDNQFFLDALKENTSHQQFRHYLESVKQNEKLAREPTDIFVKRLFADRHIIQHFKNAVLVSLTKLHMKDLKNSIILTYAEGNETSLSIYLNDDSLDLDEALAILLTKKDFTAVSDAEKKAIESRRHQLADRVIDFLKAKIRGLTVDEQKDFLQKTIHGENLLGKILKEPTRPWLYAAASFTQYMIWGSSKSTTSIQKLQIHLETLNITELRM